MREFTIPVKIGQHERDMITLSNTKNLILVF